MGEGESKPESRALIVAGETAVRDAADAARAYAAAHRIGGDDAARLCIVVEELVANLYEHGHLAIDDRVGLSFSRSIDGIAIVLTDSGPPFDPRNAGPAGAVPVRGGGAGINMVKRWATLVDYATGPVGNRLELLLPIRFE